MTRNQLEYLQIKESRRHNRATEDETKRSNLANETENKRHNVTAEKETWRNNTNTARINAARVDEEVRSNKVNEAISSYTAQQNALAKARDYATNVAKYELDKYKTDLGASQKAIDQTIEQTKIATQSKDNADKNLATVTSSFIKLAGDLIKGISPLATIIG